MTQLTDDGIDDITLKLSDFIEEEYDIRMELDSNYNPLAAFVWNLLEDYSNGHRNMN